MDETTNSPSSRQRPDSSVRGRLLSSFGVQGLAIGLRIAQQLALVPILIGGWGAELYSDWLVLFSTASMLAFLDFGIQIYFGNSLAQARARLDDAAFHRHFAIAMGLYGLILGAAVTLFVVCSGLVSWFDLLNTRSMNRLDSFVTFGTLCATTVVLIPFGIVMSVYRAFGDYARGGLIGTAAELARAVGIGAVAYSGGPPSLAGSIYLAIAVVTWSGVAFDLRRRYITFSPPIAIPSWPEFRQGAIGAASYLGPTIVVPIIVGGPVLLLGALGAAPTAIVAFSVVRTFTGFVRQVILQICHPIGAELSRHQAAGAHDRMRRIYSGAGRLVAGLAGLLSGLTLVVAGPFIQIWTHGEVPADPWLTGLFLAAIVIGAPSQVAFLLYHYNNQPKLLIVSYILQGLLMIALCAVLIEPFSARGAAAGLGIAELLSIGILAPFAASRDLRLQVLPYLARCVGFALISFAFSWGVGASLATIFDLRSLAGLAGLGLSWTALLAGPAFFTLIAKSERHWIYQTVAERIATPRRGGHQ